MYTTRNMFIGQYIELILFAVTSIRWLCYESCCFTVRSGFRRGVLDLIGGGFVECSLLR